MWEYLKHIAELLQNFKRVLQAVPDEDRDPFRRGLRASVRQRTYSFSVHLPAVRPRTASKAIPFLTGEDGNLLPAVLEYFTEGIVTLLHVFYTSFFDPTSAGALEDKEVEVSVEIARALIVSI